MPVQAPAAVEAAPCVRHAEMLAGCLQQKPSTLLPFLVGPGQQLNMHSHYKLGFMGVSAPLAADEPVPARGRLQHAGVLWDCDT